MSAALSRYQNEIQALKARASNLRQRAQEAAAEVQRDAVSVGAAGAYGALRKAGTLPPQIAGMDTDLVVIAGLYALGHLTSGQASEVAHDAAVGIACAVAYSKARA